VLFVPGRLVALITFPGVVVHEVAHVLFCRICRVAVGQTCFFRFDNPAGYVIHEKPRLARHQLLIGTGPFLVNTVLGAVIALPAAIPVMQFDASGSFLDYVLMWFGISVAMHSFPSTGDAKAMWETLAAPGSSVVLRLVGYPIVAVICLGAAGSVLWLDAIYGFAVAAWLPGVLVSAIA
jgi:hypothetical protein